jgi:hypothetical protein
VSNYSTPLDMKNIIFGIVLLQFLISCRDEYTRHILEGNWDWLSICGSFSGECGFSSAGNTKTITFSKYSFTEKSNDLITLDSQYTIKSTSNNGSFVDYEIELSTGEFWTVTLRNKSELQISKGDFWETYERKN